MKTISLILFFALLTAFPRANADDRKWDFGGGLGPNFSQVDALRNDLHRGLGVALWADRYVTPHWFGELSYGYFDFDSSSSTHLDAYALGVGYRFDGSEKYSPYVVGGAGFGSAKNFPRSTPQQTGFVWHLRPGFDYKLSERWSIGLAFDWAMIYLDGNTAKEAYVGLPILSFGWHWADEPAPPVVASTPVKPPPVAPVKDPERITEGLSLKIMVNFATGSDKVPQESEPELKKIADLLNRNPNATVQIEGHTDSMGSKKMNMDLSNRRAEAVAIAIRKKFGFAKSRISSRGFGPSKPIADNSTAEGRAMNRRVMATFKSNE